jgi:hypothetical protein
MTYKKETKQQTKKIVKLLLCNFNSAINKTIKTSISPLIVKIKRSKSGSLKPIRK